MPTRQHRPISPQSLPRFIAWAWLWLIKHAWFLDFSGPEAERCLRAMRRKLASIIAIPAAHRFPKRIRGIAGRVSPQPGFKQRGRLSGQRAYKEAAACGNLDLRIVVRYIFTITSNRLRD